MTSSGGPSSEFKDQTFLDADGITEIKPGTLLHVLAAHDKRKLDEPLDVAYGEYVVMYKFAGNDVMVMVAQSAEKAPYEVTISAEIRIDEIEQIDSSWVKASEQTDLSEETFEKAQLVGMPVGYDHRGMIWPVEEHILAHRLEVKGFEPKPKGGRIIEWRPVSEVINMLRENEFSPNSALALIHLLVEHNMVPEEPHLQSIRRRLRSELQYTDQGYVARPEVIDLYELYLAN